MNESRGRLDGIYDIAPPAVPVEGAWDTLLPGLLAAIILALILFGVWRYYHTLRVRARRRLAGLRQQYERQQLDVRAASFRLAAILRISLRLRQLSTTGPLPASRQDLLPRWQDFMAGLQAARYARNEASREQMLILFDEAEFWLRRGR
jgi:hypothetical protein